MIVKIIDYEFLVDFKALYVKSPENEKNALEDEVHKYLNTPRPHKKTDVLNWCKNIKACSLLHPRISKMARDFLSIMATSVPAEQLFSEVALVTTAKRSAL